MSSEWPMWLAVAFNAVGAFYNWQQGRYWKRVGEEHHQRMLQIEADHASQLWQRLQAISEIAKDQATRQAQQELDFWRSLEREDIQE